MTGIKVAPSTRGGNRCFFGIKQDGSEEDFRANEYMLENTAVHELALLVTYYGVTSKSIAEVTPMPEDSCAQTLGGRTDFSKVALTITTKAGKSITVKADRRSA